jgi:hypothetical protein
MKNYWLGLVLVIVPLMAACSKGNNNAGEVGANRCTDGDGKTYQVGETFKKDCNSCRCAMSPDNKLAIACTVMACLTDAAPPATADSAIDTPADTRFDTLMDTTEEIPVVDAGRDSLVEDVATDVSFRLDTAPACPASPPTPGHGPCPAGGVCEYTYALECDAGCSGGTYLRYECLNNLWQQTRATAGAPVCYCPTILDAPGEVACKTCTDRDGKTYALGEFFKRDCNTCHCALSPDNNEPAIACTVMACTVDAATADGPFIAFDGEQG